MFAGMTTICEHDRHSLVLTLARLIEEPTRPWLAIALETLSRPGATRDNCPDSARVSDLHDPAKLAEILAELFREHGVKTRCVPLEESTQNLTPGAPKGCQWIRRTEARIEIRFVYLYWDPRMLTMPQARAILYALLQLPDGAKEAVEKVLRGET
jgi:hypothetical protein